MVVDNFINLNDWLQTKERKKKKLILRSKPSLVRPSTHCSMWYLDKDVEIAHMHIKSQLVPYST